jgi:hypothetical protein
MSRISDAIVGFEKLRTLDAAQVLQVALDDAYPDDPVIQECVEDLSRYRPGGGEFLFDDNLIKPIVERVEARLKSSSNAACLICGRKLSVADDPLSVDCGGDCWGCVGQIEGDMGHEPSAEKVREEIGQGLRLTDGSPRDLGVIPRPSLAD